MAYLQAATINRTVYVTLADIPALGVLDTDVTVMIKKEGQSAFAPKVIGPADWIDLGGGIYSLVFSPADTNVVGDFTYKITSSRFDNIVYDEFTIEPAPLPVTPAILPQQCIVSGNLANITALAPSAEPLKIVFWPPQFPARFAQTILVADAVWTFADAFGNFSLPAVQGSTVIVEIKRCGIRAQIEVPMAPTANLIDLLPPFTIDYSL